MFASPGAILFQLGPFALGSLELGPLTVRWYGVLIALGFLAATYAASQVAKRWSLDGERIVNAALVSFIGGVIGARLYFVALSWQSFVSHPADILATWKGGGSIHGGIIGGVIAAVLYLRANKMPVLTCLDIGGICIPLGQAIGRWGNFFNSEAFGRPVPPDFPLKLYIPPENRPVAYQNFDFFHPTFLYESLWDLTIFALLYFLLADKLKPYPGMCFLVYLAAYSSGRVFIEMLRVDSIMLFGYPAPILVSITCLALALVGIAVVAARHLTSPPKSAR
jgi:phosphatidylglycerol:prolipoprotein diacylglycerol transferase